MSRGNVQGYGVLDLPRIDDSKRIVVGKFLRLHWELHLQFPDAQTIWTIQTQPKCSIRGAYCLNFGGINASAFVVTLGVTSKGRQRDDFLNAAFRLGKAQKGRGGVTLFSYTV